MAGLVPALHAFALPLPEGMCRRARAPSEQAQPNRMDGRDKPGHDEARKVSRRDEDGR